MRDVAPNGIAKGLGLLATACAGLAVVWGCASTEFFPEGPGQPSDRASGTVPDGELGVCRVPQTRRPLIVDEKLWENTRFCTPRTPSRYIRMGYGSSDDPNADKEQERLLGVLREGQKEDGGNQQLVNLLRALRDRGLKDPYLRDRVARETAREGVCDYTYLLNTMAKQREKLTSKKDVRCTVQVYDPAVRGDACLFDIKRNEVSWLTSSWSCVTHTGALGESTSCYQLCGYDDYCAKHVPCAAQDVDLLMCALGVCLPEPRAGIY